MEDHISSLPGRPNNFSKGSVLPIIASQVSKKKKLRDKKLLDFLKHNNMVLRSLIFIVRGEN